MTRHSAVNYGFGGELKEENEINWMGTGSSWTEKVCWGTKLGLESWRYYDRWKGGRVMYLEPKWIHVAETPDCVRKHQEMRPGRCPSPRNNRASQFEKVLPLHYVNDSPRRTETHMD